MSPELQTCSVCGERRPVDELVPASAVRESLAALIRVDFPDWSGNAHICHTDLDRYRARYVEHMLAEDRGELSQVEREFVRSIEEQELLARNVNQEFERRLKLGERISDRVAGFGGSWKFIILFGLIIIAWIAVNTAVLLRRPFDPYPYILLNLVLSCLAALQAPIILMSQNRQEARDRLRSELDYKINLKAEVEIRSLHEKIDHLIFRQWQRLLEIQEIQLQIMQELSTRTVPASEAVPGRRPPA